MIPASETRRLLLKPLALEDAPRIQALFPQWEIVRYLLNRVPWPYPPDGAEQYLRAIALPGMERGDAWIWTLRLRSAPDEPIGLIELHKGEEDNRGFWIGQQWQGHGLMTEACAWANDFWFETLGFNVLRAAKAQANTPSRRISQRHGMRLAGACKREFVSGLLEAEIWELTAAEWRAWKKEHAHC